MSENSPDSTFAPWDSTSKTPPTPTAYRWATSLKKYKADNVEMTSGITSSVTKGLANQLVLGGFVASYSPSFTSTTNGTSQTTVIGNATSYCSGNYVFTVAKPSTGGGNYTSAIAGNSSQLVDGTGTTTVTGQDTYTAKANRLDFYETNWYKYVGTNESTIQLKSGMTSENLSTNYNVYTQTLTESANKSTRTTNTTATVQAGQTLNLYSGGALNVGSVGSMSLQVNGSKTESVTGSNAIYGLSGVTLASYSKVAALVGAMGISVSAGGVTIGSMVSLGMPPGSASPVAANVSALSSSLSSAESAASSAMASLSSQATSASTTQTEAVSNQSSAASTAMETPKAPAPAKTTSSS